MGSLTFLILPLLAAGLSALAFPPFLWAGFGLLALWPLFWLAEQPTLSYKKLMFSFFLYGFLHLLIFHRWLLVMTIWLPLAWLIPAWVAFALYLGFFYAATGAVIKRFRGKLPLALLFPAAWTFFEWLRALGPLGNPAGSLGYTFTEMPTLLQWASVGGVYGLTFLGVLLSFGVYHLLKSTILTKKKPLKLLGLWGGIFAFFMVGGLILHSRLITTEQSIRVSVIQANHTQSLKLNGTYWPYIRRAYLAQTQSALTHEKPDLVIWPETITSSLNTKMLSFMADLQRMAQENDATIVFGTPIKRDGFYYNSAALVTPFGLSGQTYDKVFLMPFGEYWPCKSFFARCGIEWAAGNEFTSGTSHKELITPAGFLGISICLESLYPWHARKQHRSDILIAMVNNAWFLDSPAAAQHYQMSRLRAVENNRYLVQSANTGISGIITPKGYSLIKSNLDTEATITKDIYTGLPRSLYSYSGEWIIVLCVGLLAWAARFKPRLPKLKK